MPDAVTVGVPAPVRALLWLSVPIAAGAVLASATGLVAASVYEAETVNWAAQARGQDAVNLVAYPLLLVLAWRAGRGSVPAFLGWLGVLAYSAYSYLLYAGWVHFGGLFLVHVATFGLSTHALVGAMASVEPVGLRRAFRPTTPHDRVGTVLATLGSMFALLWLSEIVPAMLDGSTPQPLLDAGLPSNPVWVLDLGIVLPAMVLAGVLLRRDRPLGYVLAGPLLVFGVAMGLAIVGMFVALAAAGEAVPIAPVVVIGLVVVVEAGALVGLLRHLRPGTRVVDVLRPRGQATAGPAEEG